MSRTDGFLHACLVKCALLVPACRPQRPGAHPRMRMGLGRVRTGNARSVPGSDPLARGVRGSAGAAGTGRRSRRQRSGNSDDAPRPPGASEPDSGSLGETPGVSCPKRMVLLPRRPVSPLRAMRPLADGVGPPARHSFISCLVSIGWFPRRWRSSSPLKDERSGLARSQSGPTTTCWALSCRPVL